MVFSDSYGAGMLAICLFDISFTMSPTSIRTSYDPGHYRNIYTCFFQTMSCVQQVQTVGSTSLKPPDPPDRLTQLCGIRDDLPS